MQSSTGCPWRSCGWGGRTWCGPCWRPWGACRWPRPPATPFSARQHWYSKIQFTGQNRNLGFLPISAGEHTWLPIRLNQVGNISSRKITFAQVKQLGPRLTLLWVLGSHARVGRGSCWYKISKIREAEKTSLHFCFGGQKYFQNTVEKIFLF